MDIGLWILDFFTDTERETWLPFYNFCELLLEIKGGRLAGGVHLKTD